MLTYHVVSGAVTSGQIKDGQVIPTVDAGQSVTAHVAGGQVKINNARVIRANIMCTNGVVHIVDQVLVPGNFNYPKVRADGRPSPASRTAPLPSRPSRQQHSEADPPRLGTSLLLCLPSPPPHLPSTA